jgi:murein DD-endopeptidase MepM/ murein hydrolase activator NlpD
MRPRTTASSTGSSSITESPVRLGLALLGLALALVFGPVVAPEATGSGRPNSFRGLKGAVLPKATAADSVTPQRLVFRYRAASATSLEIRIRRITAGPGPGRLVSRTLTRPLEPGRWHRRIWRGLDRRGRLAPAGRYSVRIGPAGGRLRTLARLRIRGHLFPVGGPHGTRGYIGQFGAPRYGGRIHEGFDVTASCGTPLVAPRASVVLKNAYDAELKGYYVVMKGRGERRTYLYAHLARRAPVTVDQKIRAGRRVGTVGQTGNAAGTPCHLHIEIRSRGKLLDPEPLLYSWDL